MKLQIKFPSVRQLTALILLFIVPFSAAVGEPGVPAVVLQTTPEGEATYSVTIQILFLMTILTLLPSMVLTMTSFTRIVIVLFLLRQALGTMQTPSTQVLMGLALFLTIFIMTPVLERINGEALQPYMAETIPAQEALLKASAPLKEFMLHQTRENDLATFIKIANLPELDSAEEVPMSVLIPAFVTSELKTAFQIGFLIFIPFLVIDMVVASTLMAMGMMMLSPMIISMPFKIMMFILIDGWTLVMGTLASSFYV